MDGTGQKGEDFAAGALADAGMEILCRNYKKRWGEIDIIAKDGEYLAFVEVKPAERAAWCLRFLR